MKKAKKLLALLLAGVLALSVLVGCSGSAGPLTKENVTDYIIDYYKAGMGIQLTEDTKLKSVADNIVAYVNGEIGDKNMPTLWAFWSIVNNADNKESWLEGLPQTEGYAYSVGYVSIDESYKTDLFNQGKTAVTAAALVTYRSQILIKEWTKEPKSFPTTGEIYVVESTVNGQKCMIAVLREPVTYYNGGGSASHPVEPDPSEPDPSTGVTTGA